MTGSSVSDKVEGSDRGPILRHYPSICLEGLRNTTISLSHDSRSPGRELNTRLPEHEAEVNHSITYFGIIFVKNKFMSVIIRDLH
jgi:hypothetical protein